MIDPLQLPVGSPITVAFNGHLRHMHVENVLPCAFDAYQKLYYHTSHLRMLYIHQGVYWLPGHIPFDGDEAKALLVASALT